jgi:hypothetical protein
VGRENLQAQHLHNVAAVVLFAHLIRQHLALIQQTCRRRPRHPSHGLSTSALALALASPGEPSLRAGRAAMHTPSTARLSPRLAVISGAACSCCAVNLIEVDE